MDSRTSLLQRPLGPRTQKRNALPLRTSNLAPQPEPEPEPAPAFVKSPPLSLSIPTPTPRAVPMMGIPKPPGSRPSAPKIKLQINATPSAGPLFEVYAGGPSEAAAESTMSPDEQTIRPPSTILATAKPAVQPIDSLRAFVETGLDGLKITDQPEPLVDAPETQTRKYSDADFEELDRLGEGAGGAVHKVKDKATGFVLARKTVTTREAPMKQLQRELRIAMTVVNPNIIRTYGAYMSPSMSEVKIVMDFCEGGSLESISKQLKERGAIIGEKIAGRIAEGVLQGLDYLHGLKLIHRDIKPPNILLSREGVVKLCDFGVSGQLVNSMAGTFTGTSFYMAPERICGHDYSIRSDVWSTGISLLELVQNRFPFPPDLGAIELMMYITTGEPPRLEDEPDKGVSWSPDMKDFISKTLIVDATTRPTPKDMLSHPWIETVMKQEVHMARWIRQVWGWKKATRRSRDESTSRPSTAQGGA